MAGTPWDILAAGLTRLSDRVDAMPTVREASVTASDPLAIRFDTDTADITPAGSLVSAPAVGARVLTLKLRHYVWVLGIKGGAIPAGVGMDWFGTTAPAGWLLADGAVKLRADYPALFAVIGTTYNTGGESALQFRLPNKKGRVGVGLDTSQTEFDTLGEQGGAKTHTLGYRELPVQKGTRITWGQGNISFSGDPQAQASAPGGNGMGTWENDARYDADSANNMASGGQPHNNLQPYVVQNFIIKT